MATNYPEMVQMIDDLIGRGDARPHIPKWIRWAEEEIVHDCLDLTGVTYITSGTILSGADTLALPDGIEQIKTFELVLNPIQILTSVTLEELKRLQALNQSGVSNPFSYCWIDNVTVELVPAPNANRDYKIYWEGKTPEMTQATAASQLLLEAEQAVLYGAAKHAGPHFRDPSMMGVYDPMYQASLTKFKKHRAHSRLTTVQPASSTRGMYDGMSGGRSG